MERIGTLPVGEGTYLDPAVGAPVLIIGHPVLEKVDKDAPLRFDWGNEALYQNEAERIRYDLTTLGGNSGSPVFGKGGKVKGIHVEGGGPGTGSDMNRAQRIDDIIFEVKKKVQEYRDRIWR